MSRFSSAFIPAWKRPARRTARPASPALEFLSDIDGALGAGDKAQLARQYGEAIAHWRSARGKILRLLLPAIDEALSGDAAELPSGAHIEQQMAQAAIALLEAIQQAPSTPPIVAPPVATLLPAVASLAAVGFHTAADSDLNSRASSAAQLLAVGRTREAVASLDGLVADLAGAANPDMRVRGSVRLNRAAGRIALGDPRSAREDAEAARADFTAARDDVGRAQALHTLAVAMSRMGDARSAARLFRSAADMIGPLSSAAANPGTRAAPTLFQRLISGFAIAPPESPGDRAAAAAAAGRDAAAPSRDLGTLDFIAASSPARLSVKWPGAGGGVASIPVPTVLDDAARDASWSVGIRRGTAVVALTWQSGKRPSPAALLDAVYDPRKGASDAASLYTPIAHFAELAAQLPYLYSYALPRRLGDAHQQIGEHARAAAEYRVAAGFGFLNRTLEGVALWGCIAANAVAWGDALYRAEDIAGCRAKYGEILTAQRTEPAGALLYTDPALAIGAESARRVIASLDPPPADVDPAIAMPIMRAAMRFEYLEAGLDFYGTDFTPVFTFGFLQEAARQFALRGIQAERDYVQFQSQAEGEAATRRELEAALAAASAERDARAEHLNASRREREALAAALRKRWRAMAPLLDERSRRRWAASEARMIGHGGVSAAAAATGLARRTIYRGLADLKGRASAKDDRIRRRGGGRKSRIAEDPTLLADLKLLVEPATRGDPMRRRLWTSLSLRKLSKDLKGKGHEISYPVVGDCLRKLGYSLQANRKSHEGSGHMDRNAQFEYISKKAGSFLTDHQPVISVDTKKKELVGDFKNAGREWRPKGAPEEVNVHDFIDPKLKRAVPCGVYDINSNTGWVSVGTDHDTAAFAVNAIRRWWKTMGKRRYPKPKGLMVTADGGGSNGYRVRLWKIELQKLADELKFPITVCHLPPGTSKWNKIEHRLFSFISINWRGKPLRSFRTIVQLIAATTTETGLTVRAELDENKYPKGLKISDAQIAAVNIFPHDFRGEWNYTIAPIKKRSIK